MQMEITLNETQRLYVIPCGGGYSCLGFDVAAKRTAAIADELQRPELMPTLSNIGTLAGYEEYSRAVEAARLNYEKTGQRLRCDLIPELIGLEGKRVEVVDAYGEKRRFIVGKSSGWIPCHLELKTRASHGGGSVTGAPFKSVRVIN